MTNALDPTRAALNAIENGSRIPLSRDDLPRLLSTGEGEGSHLRALFGDVDLHSLLALATYFDIDDPTLVRAYARARETAAAANADLDEYAASAGLTSPEG
jgi:hypothetical protein